jgi:serine protease Do
MKKFLVFLVSIVICASLLTGCTAANTSPTTSTTPTTSTPPVIQPSNVIVAFEQALEQIYGMVEPSVVYIEVIPQQIINAVSGSGFVWDNAGHIVTNDHVVSGGGDIAITFYDGTIVPATVIGEDADSDLAVLKFDTSAYKATPVTMGDSSQLKVGQVVVAIGNPFGLQSTLTVGHVSGLARTITGNVPITASSTYSIPSIIQTDAAINPGNSGGVLVDDGGRVIGVTAQIASQSGTSSGVGFAIPQAIVSRVVPALITQGKYSHPYLGISGLSMDPDIAKAMNLNSNQRGALVATVTPGGPAAQAGLLGSNENVTILGQPISVGGDIIIAVNDQTINSFDDLTAYVALSTSPGQQITLTILRNGQQMQVTVIIGSRPSS